MKISVVIPVFNAEKWLSRLLISLNNQECFKDLEIIFINDGSTDKTYNILKEFANNKENIVVKNTENNGVSRARNLGIKNATCEYITFLDADDFVENDYFKCVLEEIEKSNDEFDMIVSGFVVEYKDKIINKFIKNTIILKENEILEAFLLGRYIDPNVWNKIFKTEIVKKINFNENIRIAEDKLFVFEYLRLISEVKIVSLAKYHYMVNEESVCRKEFSNKNFDSLKVSKVILDTIRKEYPEFYGLAESLENDVKCRIFCDLSMYSKRNEFIQIYYQLKKDIKAYSIIKKIKYSNKKHLIGFILCRIHPKLYIYLKNNLKLQYKD